MKNKTLEIKSWSSFFGSAKSTQARDPGDGRRKERPEDMVGALLEIHY